jgi:hypothetical protein
MINGKKKKIGKKRLALTFLLAGINIIPLLRISLIVPYISFPFFKISLVGFPKCSGPNWCGGTYFNLLIQDTTSYLISISIYAMYS